MESLEYASEYQIQDLIVLKVEPLFDEYRAIQEFQAFEEKLNIPSVDK